MTDAFPIVDAHQHFWDPRAHYYPWLCDAEMIPFRYGDYSAIRRPYLPHDYAADTAGYRVVKTVHIEAEWDPTVPHSGDRLFWCQTTQQCLGPDGKTVDDYECNPARKCYKPF